MANKNKKNKSPNCFQECRTQTEACVDGKHQKYDCDIVHYQCMRICLDD